MSKVSRMKHIRMGKPDRAQRELGNRNQMKERSLIQREKRGGLSPTEFRRFRRQHGLGYMEASRALH